MVTIKDVISSIYDAQKNWSDWNWSTSFTDLDGEVFYVNGDANIDKKLPSDIKKQALEYSKAVNDTVSIVHKLGDKAVKDLEKKNVHKALLELEEASSVESSWGSDPVWSIPRKNLEKLIDETLLLLDDYMDVINVDVDKNNQIVYSVNGGMLHLKVNKKKLKIGLLNLVDKLRDKTITSIEEFKKEFKL
jgi:hypothetical protein